MNRGWLKLRQRDTDLPALVWITDVEMVAAIDGGGCWVYVHHDKIAVREDPEWVVEQVDAVNEFFAAQEK